MSNTATMRHMNGKTVGPPNGKRGERGEHFEPSEELREYMESLSAAELRELGSYAKKMAVGKENPERGPGQELSRWLVAQYIRGSGPYFYLQSYITGDLTYTDHNGRQRSGKGRTRYVGRRLPADLAEEFGYPEGVTPEDSGINVTGTPNESKRRKALKASTPSEASETAGEREEREEQTGQYSG